MKLFHIRLKAGPFCDAQCVEKASDNFDRSHLLQPRSKTSKSEYHIPGKCGEVRAAGEIRRGASGSF
jgi:hypothetical protein